MTAPQDRAYPKRKKRRTYLWASRTSRKISLRRRTILQLPKKGFGVPRVKTFKPVKTRVVITRVPRQRVVVVKLRKVRYPIATTNPYTRTQSIYRSVYRYFCNQALLESPPNVSVVRNYYDSTRTGRSNPKWKAQITAGANATTVFSATRNGLSARNGSISMAYQDRINASSPWLWRRSMDSSWVNQLNVAPITSHFSGAADKEAEDRALRLLYKKIYQARHQLQGGVILGEIDKTARLLLGTAKKLKSGVFDYLSTAVGIRRGRGSNNLKRKQIASSYLEAVFGWQPLVMDCEDLAKTLGRLCHESDKVRFRAGAESVAQTYHAVASPVYGFLSCNITTIEMTSMRVIYRGIFRGTPYESGSPPLERIISMSGFDLRSFVPTMWELIPYSFVVDYFTNIGDCLQALCTDTSIVQVLWKTTVKESKRIMLVCPDKGKSESNIKVALSGNIRGLNTEKTDGLVEVTRVDTNRFPTGVPVMVPQIKGLDLPFKQFANLGALIIGKTGKP